MEDKLFELLTFSEEVETSIFIFMKNTVFSRIVKGGLLFKKRKGR